MMRLEIHQRGLLDLVKGRGAPPEDPYLRRIAGSRELMMIREIAIWWRKFQLEAQCHLTSRLLKHLGCFDETVVSYNNNNQTSPFVEELTDDFLSSLRMHHDHLVRTVAQFERALLKVRAGVDEHFEILWDRHPDLVFRAIEKASELPPPKPGCIYRMRIARDLPSMVACRSEVLPEPGPIRTALST
jgi:hypothetical protein